jgi:hypothetical protein
MISNSILNRTSGEQRAAQTSQQTPCHEIPLYASIGYANGEIIIRYGYAERRAEIAQ